MKKWLVVIPMILTTCSGNHSSKFGPPPPQQTKVVKNLPSETLEELMKNPAPEFLWKYVTKHSDYDNQVSGEEIARLAPKGSLLHLIQRLEMHKTDEGAELDVYLKRDVIDQDLPDTYGLIAFSTPYMSRIKIKKDETSITFQFQPTSYIHTSIVLRFIDSKLPPETTLISATIIGLDTPTSIELKCETDDGPFTVKFDSNKEGYTILGR